MSDESLIPASISHLILGVSASDSPDLARLGLPATHVRDVLGGIADLVLSGGGKLAYGGHLDPEGYTTVLLAKSRGAGRRDCPLLVCLPWTEHRRMRLTQLRERSDLGPFGEVVCLDADGTPVDPAIGRGEEAVPEDDPQVRRRSLTSMRRYLVDRTGARVLVGGKRHGFSGALPGLVEEALIALEARQPLYLAAGCGGVTADIARALGIDDGARAIDPDEAGMDEAGMDDSALREGRARLEALAGSAEWSGLDNGLTADENSLLARSRQPGEIAGLVRLGLGRLARDGNPPR